MNEVLMEQDLVPWTGSAALCSSAAPYNAVNLRNRDRWEWPRKDRTVLLGGLAVGKVL